MAKKAETVSMIDTLAEFKELKNIDKDTMISVLEESFRNVIAKMFGTDENYDVIINPEKGDFEIWRNRKVVADNEVTDANLQISLSDARQIDPDCEVGEDLTDEVNFADFGRRAILNLRQTLASKILEYGKRKCCCSMMKVMNCYCRNKNRFQVISIAKVKQPGRLCYV